MIKIIINYGDRADDVDGWLMIIVRLTKPEVEVTCSWRSGVKYVEDISSCHTMTH